MEECRLFIIGAGSGGIRAARRAAEADPGVVLAEKGEIGGTCVHRGCVPKKIFFYAGALADEAETARSFGWRFEPPRLDWPALIRAKDREIARLDGIYRQLLRGVRVESGHARLEDAHHVRVGPRRWRAETIVLATGGAPFRPPIEGIEHAITSDEVFHLPSLPRRWIVIGAGYIGVEFASFFRALGSRVTLIHRSDLPVAGFDLDIRRNLAQRLAGRGIDLRPGCHVERIEKTPQGVRVTTRSGETFEADVALCAAGRRPNTADLGLENAGLKPTAAGHIDVDAEGRTAVPHIFAIGDIVDHPALTPVAIAQASRLVALLRGESPPPLNPDTIPTAVFCDPPIAAVGLSEQTAHERGLDISIHTSRFRPLKYALRDDGGETMIKWVLDRRQERVLGLHMIGLDAPEIVSSFAPALALGIEKSRLDALVGIHPTSAEELVSIPASKGAAPPRRALPCMKN